MSEGYTNPKIKYVNGILKCSFTRMKQVTGLGSKHFNLDNEYYLLTANGLIDSTNRIIRHTSRDASSQKIKLVPLAFTGTI